MSSKKPPTIPVNRSAITGRFVTEATVRRHPNTTVTEHVRKPK